MPEITSKLVQNQELGLQYAAISLCANSLYLRACIVASSAVFLMRARTYLDFTLSTTLKLIASQLLEDVSSCFTEVDPQSCRGEKSS